MDSDLGRERRITMEDSERVRLTEEQRKRMTEELLRRMGAMKEMRVEARETMRTVREAIKEEEAQIEMLRLALAEGAVARPRQMDIEDQDHARSVLIMARSPLSAKVAERRAREEMPDDED